MYEYDDSFDDDRLRGLHSDVCDSRKLDRVYRPYQLIIEPFEELLDEEPPSEAASEPKTPQP